MEVFGKWSNSRIDKVILARTIVVKFYPRIFLYKICIQEFYKREDLFRKFLATTFEISRLEEILLFLSFRDLFVKFYLCEKFTRQSLNPLASTTLFCFLIKQTETKITGSRCKSNGGGLYF